MLGFQQWLIDCKIQIQSLNWVRVRKASQTILLSGLRSLRFVRTQVLPDMLRIYWQISVRNWPQWHTLSGWGCALLPRHSQHMQGTSGQSSLEQNLTTFLPCTRHYFARVVYRYLTRGSIIRQIQYLKPQCNDLDWRPDHLLDYYRMVQRTAKRSIDDLYQLVAHLEAIYNDFHSKSTSVLQIIKSASKDFGAAESLSGKASCDILVLTGQFYQKVWNSSTKKIQRLEEEGFFFETLRDRIRQFSEEYRQTKNDIVQTVKGIQTLKQMHTELQKLFRDYQKPSKYYNTVEGVQAKKELGQKLADYSNKKAAFMTDYPSKKKVITYIHHITDWFNREIDDGLLKGSSVVGRVQEGLLARVRQLIHYILDTCTKEIQRLERVETETHWTIQKDQFNRQNLNILNKLRSLDSKQQTQSCFNRFFKFSKDMMLTIEEEIKSSDTTFGNLRNMMSALQSVRRQVERQETQTEVFKDRLQKINPDPGFFDSYKLTLHKVLQLIEITVQSIRQNFEGFKMMQRVIQEKKKVDGKIKMLLGRDILRTPQNLIELCRVRGQQLHSIEQIQIQSKRVLKEQVIRNLNGYLSQVRIVEAQLLKGQKEIYRQKRPSYFVKTDLVTQILTIDLLNDDLLEKEVSQSVHEFTNYTMTHKNEPLKVYNCALGGKLLLAGKMKLYPQLLLFESAFNKKNIFFGRTSLTIPLSDIIQIKKESLMLVSNSISIETKKGPLSFTSFYQRDKVFEEINELLDDGEEQLEEKNESVCSRASLGSVLEVFTQEDLVTIEDKRKLFKSQLFDNYKVVASKQTFPGVSIRKIFRLIYSSDNQIIKKKHKYRCFKEYGLSQTNNSEIVVGQIEPPPPSYFQTGSPSKLSQLKCSARQFSYKHELGSLPIPFMPKFGSVTEKQAIHWISNKMFIIDADNMTTGPPYSDTFILKFKTIVQQTQEGVQITTSGQVQFVKSASFQGIIRSTGQKQLNKNTQIVSGLIKEYINESRRKKTKATANGSKQIQQEVQPEPEPEPVRSSVRLGQQIQNLQLQNKKNLIIVSGVFLFLLMLTHLLF